jgi:tetraacyldisaccharide 4'-kinase
MLARIAPTYIAAQRDLAIQMAENNGATVVIMDDGLQNQSVEKNISLLVIDGKFGIGNGLILPAGPLRENLSYRMTKCDAVIFVGEDSKGVLKHPSFNNKQTPPVIRARLIPSGNLPDKNKPYIAFAGIGNPDKFFSTLAENSYNIVETIPFPDHYNYSDSDMNTIIHKAEAKSAGIITTQKDEVRLPLFAKKKVQVLPVRIAWDDETKIRNVLEKIIKK